MKKVAVVGAGMAGLAASIYLARSGFEVTLCERGAKPGGMFTGWKRKDYFFEGAMDWLAGANPKKELHNLLRETGAINDTVKAYFHDICHCIDWEGRTLYIYRDIEKTARQLLAISPEDKKALCKMVKDVKKLSLIDMPSFNVKGVKMQNRRRIPLGEIIKMLPGLFKIIELESLNCENYLKKFKHPGIRRLFSFIWSEVKAVDLLFVLAVLHSGDGAYLEGGSLAMMGRMAKTFTGLGGKLLLNTEVKKVNIENGIASGVTLENGGIIPADAVIAAQETIAALNKLFDPPLKDNWLKEIQKTKPAVNTLIGIGVRAEIPGSPVPEWRLEQPITHAGIKVTEMGFFNYTQYGYAPQGCSVVVTRLKGDTYDFWKKAKDEGRYETEKQALAGQIKREFCFRFPQAEGKIEVIDIATPLTYERFTNAYHGSWMAVTVPGDKMKLYPGFLKSVKNLFFAGHRLIPPGGLPVALMSGRRAAQLVCRRFKTTFI